MKKRIITVEFHESYNEIYNNVITICDNKVRYK